jgi:hypothetical protein
VALILDGYNLIGALDRYRAAGTLDAARDLLVNDALKAAGWTGRLLIVVFDAHRGPEPERSESRAGGAVRVIYSAPGESADDVIERLLSRLEGSATVYTADFARPVWQTVFHWRLCVGWKRYAGGERSTLASPPLLSTALRAFSACPDGLHFQRRTMSGWGLRCYNLWRVTAGWSRKALAESVDRKSEAC